jgi:hypothetical protein
MPAPTKDKTWQFTINFGPILNATSLLTSQATLYQVKAAMIGFASNPWTVSGSSNSSTSGMDATDRWVTSANLVWAAGAHSWIVLRQAGIATKFEVCFDLNSGSDTLMTVVVSPAAGFGTANGGTNGTTSARPTATDETVVRNTTDWMTGGSHLLHWVHVMQSSDGQCTRVLLCTSNAPHTLMIFDRVKNPVSGWTGTTAFFGLGCLGTAGNHITYAQYLDAKTNINFRHSSTNGQFYLVTPGYISAAIGRANQGLVPHDITREWPLTPMTLYSDSTSLRGLWGTVYDLYWGSTSQNSMTSYEASGVSHSWAQFGEMVFPWDGINQQRVG